MKEVQFTSIASCEANWFNYDVASDGGSSSEVVVVDTPVLDELKLLFESDTGWKWDVGASKPELEEEWGLLRD